MTRYDPTELENIVDTFGVPEVEVRAVDENGRAEYGALRVDQRVQLAPEVQQKLDALLANDADFRRVWNREKRMPRDNSWSGFAQSIANGLALIDPPLSDQGIIDILSVHRRDHGDPGKRGPKPLGWFMKFTVPKAREFAAKQKATEAARNARREKREAKAQAEAVEKKAITAAVEMSPDEARAKLWECSGLEVRCLVQIGTGIDPAFRLELAGDQRIEFPNLKSVCGFVPFDQHVWLVTGQPLPSAAKKTWPEIRALLGRLKLIEDVGGGSGEMLVTYLREWLFRYRNGGHEFFYQIEEDLIKVPPGPLTNDQKFPSRVHGSYAYWPKTTNELVIALKLLQLPAEHKYAACAICWQDKDRVFAVFKRPPFFDFLRVDKKWTKDIESLQTLLHDADFRRRSTALFTTLVKEATGSPLTDPSDKDLRLKRVCTGWLDDEAPAAQTDELPAQSTQVHRIDDHRRRAAGDLETVQ